MVHGVVTEVMWGNLGVTWGNVEVTGKVIALVVWGKSKESHLRGLKCSDLFGILRALADEALCNRARCRF